MTTAAPPYLDASLSASARTVDLLARMTRAEKISQLGAVWAFEVVDDGSLDVERLRALANDGLGQLTRLAGATNLAPRQVASAANAIQRFLVEETRLGIPAIIHEECLHGLMALDAPSFQQSIGAAATFDPTLVNEVAATIRERMMATGARHALGPVLDISRDPRWGRIEETYGEDPYLAAAMGAAYVRGLQGDQPSSGVLATAKHMVGHGIAEGGLNQAPVHVGRRELEDEQLFPFETAILDAAIATVMPAYCDVDGLPCHASHELLVEILRQRWGFEGMVVSDYAGIEMLSTAHRLTDDLQLVAKVALEAGVDVELPRRSVYGEPLKQALDTGLLSEELLDRSVGRVLEAKFRLGLFERPYVSDLTVQRLAELELEETRVARALARRSMVLLTNDDVLPLAVGTRRVAVIGPGADSPREYIGDYSHLVHVETLIETRRNRSTAFGIVDSDAKLSLADELAGRETVLSALRDRLPSTDVRYAPGVGLHDVPDADADVGVAEAVALARASDVVIFVGAERSGLTEDSTTGEFRDRRDLGLFGRQQELLQAVAATGTPVVLVVVSGRPLALEWAAENCAAVLLAWVPGEAGPAAIADILVGQSEPGGRLPVSMPRNVGQVPLSYRHHPTGGRSNPKGDYVDGSTTPLFPFGHGLSFTYFELAELRVSSDRIDAGDGELTVGVDVVNTGARRGHDVVQLYVRDEEASVARPVSQLLGFQSVELDPGQRASVEFTIHAEQFAYTDASYRRVVEPGNVTIMVGHSSSDLPLRARIAVTGEPIVLFRRSHFLTKSEVT